MDINSFAQAVLKETVLLIKAPATNPQMIWITVPLVITTLLMTFYFGKHIKEQLGWNTALGNSVVLFFVGLKVVLNPSKKCDCVIRFICNHDAIGVFFK